MKELRGQTIAIIGGTSDIAGHLIPKLIDMGPDSIVATARGSDKAKALQQRFPDIRVVDADVTNPESLNEALGGVTGLLMCAASYGLGNNSKTWKTNADGALNVCNAATKAGVETLVHLSSIAVYGDPRTISVCSKDGKPIITEDTPPAAVRSAYGGSKAYGEGVFNDSSIPHVWNVRPAQVIGPRMETWSQKLVRDPHKYAALFGRRPFHVAAIDDVVSGCLYPFRQQSNGKDSRSRDALLIASDSKTTWLEMIKAHHQDSKETLALLDALEVVAPALNWIASSGMRVAGTIYDCAADALRCSTPISREAVELVYTPYLIDATSTANKIGDFTPLPRVLEQIQDWVPEYRKELAK